MNRNKKTIIIIMILLLFIISSSIIIINAYRQNSDIINVSLKKFEPFSKNNLLINVDTTLKIEDNLPKIEGASAFYPFSANLVQNIYDENAYTKGIVKLVSTSEAFEDIIDGSADIIIATAPSDEQKKKIEESNIELEYNVLFIEPLVIYKNINNPVNNISIDDLVNIYTKKCNWNNYTKYNKDIVSYQLEKNNGSQTCFETIVKDNVLDENHKEIKYMEKIIDSVGEDESGIGYAFSSYYNKMHINKNTCPIYINGYDYTSSLYPLQFEVYIIYNKNNENENIAKIVNWLKSNEGQEYISKTI